MPLTSGEILHNRYRIVKLLGQGGFGAVYRGWDLNLQRPCAIKENLETGLESREQFEREARMLSNLTHPNLPRVTDYFFISGQGQYLVMDFIEGDDLQDKLDQAAGPLPEAQVLSWIEQVSEALNYLHNQNPPIIHRDIKPKNLIIRPDGQAFIVDFGIAKLHDPQKRTTLGARAVTSGYSPPEQYGAGATDARSDVYSLGATLYTLLTNSVPPESISRQMGTPLPPARSLNPKISHNTERALHTALELQPDSRFQSVREFSNNMYGLVEFQRSAKPQVFPSAIQAQTVKTPSRSRKSWYIGGIIAVMTACLIPILLYINFSSQIKSIFLPVTPSPTNTPTSLVLSLSTQSNTTHTPSPTTEQKISTNTPIPPTQTKTLTLTSTQTETPTPTPTLPYGGGGLVAFNSNRTGNNEIFTIDTQSRITTQLTFRSADDRVPSWSRDGEMIAFQSRGDGDWDIYVLSLTSSALQQVTSNDCNDFAPNWSPDGRSFTFYSDCDGNREIFIMDIDGSNRVQLTHTTNTYNWFPTWSPDGNQITFSSNSTGHYQIHVMNADGTSSHALHRGCISSFSPNGKQIVFTTYCSDSGDIWLMNTDGSNPHILSDYDNNTNPAWSRDGSKIVFQSDKSGSEDIWIMELDGSNWIKLTDDPARDAAPVWQPAARDGTN